MTQTRRTFLELSAFGLAAVAAPRTIWSATAENPQTPKKLSPISAWVTSDNERFASSPSIAWGPSSASAGAEQLQLTPQMRYQEILGFGGAFTDAACYTFNRLSPSAREQLFDEMFHPSQMGLSVGRVCVGSSDYATKVYSFDEGEADPELTRFSIEHDREYILPVLRQVRTVNPDLFLFSSPWSPPGWMKFNGSMLGGSMRNHYLAAYAKYYLKFLKAYAAEQVPVQALTSQNEVDTDQDGRMPACIWPQEYEIQFVRDHLGPLLETSNMSTKIWVLDHNYNLWGRAICTLDDAKLRKYSNAVAWHGYVGAPEMMSKVHEVYPEVEMHWTEGGPDYKDPAYLSDWSKWSATFSGILRNWCRSITSWNLALDEIGRPNVGPFSCGGVVTIHSQTAEISRSGQFWALAHYSRVIRRGAHRFQSESALADLQHVAFENSDGTQALILTNAGSARTIELKLASYSASIRLKANSVTTLAWSVKA